MPEEFLHFSADALTTSARHVSDLESFQSWARGPLRDALPHQALLCGQLVPHSGGYTALLRCTVDVPDAYLAQLERPGNNLRSPMLVRLLQAPDQVHYFDPQRDADWGRSHPKWYEHYLQAGWRNSLVLGYSVGQDDDTVFTAATFYSVEPHRVQNPGDLQQPIMKAVHVALCSWHVASQARLHPKLTKAEQAIAPLLKQGKSNKEIAKHLGKSDQTVKHQISDLMHKFETHNRVELVNNLGRA